MIKPAPDPLLPYCPEGLADVKQLVPFHFSRRYENRPEAVYREIGAVCSRIVVPRKNGGDG